MNYNDITSLIKLDMKAALGCTEPGIISLSCAKAASVLREKTGQEATLIKVGVNAGIYKNAYSCGIPGTPYTGNEYAAAIGAIAGDPNKELRVLEGVSDEEIRAARELTDSGRVRVQVVKNGPGILVDAVLVSGEHLSRVVIKDSHTHYSYIECDGEELYSDEYDNGHIDSSTESVLNYSFKDFDEYIRLVPYSDISFINEAVTMNKTLADEGLKSEKCTITRGLINSLSKDSADKLINGEYPDTEGLYPGVFSKILTSAAVEARFLGAPKPAMSITGSGAHGLICTLPLIAEAYALKADEERLIRAIALNYLVTMHIKENSGKLSAFCGCGIAGGLGLSYALSYLRGYDENTSKRAFDNMTSSVTGMLCTGGNQACALKAAAAVDAAYTAVLVAERGASVPAFTGILSDTPERTSINIGRIADPGMIVTDEVLSGILTDESRYRYGEEIK